MQAYDVAIVGGGITGCALAFELGRYRVKTALLERSNDVAAGATRANSGIVHAGYDPEPGTLMARCNVEGNALIRELAPALGVSYRNNGSLVVALSEEDRPRLKNLFDRGIQNGVPGLELLSGEEARRREPQLAAEVVGALYAPTAGIISPWEFALALAETAVRSCPNTRWFPSGKTGRDSAWQPREDGKSGAALWSTRQEPTGIGSMIWWHRIPLISGRPKASIICWIRLRGIW